MRHRFLKNAADYVSSKDYAQFLRDRAAEVDEWPEGARMVNVNLQEYYATPTEVRRSLEKIAEKEARRP